MEYKLKKAIQIYKKDSGDYINEDTIEISFKGKKGAIALMKLQDIIFQSFIGKETKGNSKNKDEDKADDVVLTPDTLFEVLGMLGNSSILFEETMNSLKAFATIGDLKLDDKLQDELDNEDLEGLYEAVVKNFLLPKVLRAMQSNMKK